MRLAPGGEMAEWHSLIPRGSVASGWLRFYNRSQDRGGAKPEQTN